MFTYSVDIHFKGRGWDTFTVAANCIENAKYVALNRVSEEISIEIVNELVDCVRVYNKEQTELYKEYDI